MPLYQHKTRGFRLAEDAYVRRCEQGEFSRDEFAEVVEAATEEPKEVAPPASVAVETSPVIEFIEKSPPAGPPSADDDEIAHHTKSAPRKSRR